jgi:hypothetical protein
LGGPVDYGVRIAEIADNWPANVVWTVDEFTLSAAASLAEVGSEQPVKETFLFCSRLPGGVGAPHRDVWIQVCGSVHGRAKPLHPL